ncbi:MAG: hypothetical protein HKN87_15870, partial [Saprospiraceae bacterium]|nr:hypothetical protein [Saprospiraceae bacterium]
ALDAYGRKILVTEFTYPAQRLYDKLGAFKDLQKIDGMRLYIRSDFAKLLPPKGPRFAELAGLWKGLDKLVNLFLDLRFLFGRRIGGSSITYHEEIDQEIMQFMATTKTAEIFRRGQAELNWILSHPWIKQQSASDGESEKYHFSSIAKRFRFVPLTLSDDAGNCVAFLMFAIRDRHLKIPYCYFDESGEKEVKTCIAHHLIKWKISTCTFFHPRLVRLFTNDHYPALHTRKMQRHYIISTVFTQFDADQVVSIQDGDADCAFT